MKDYQKIYEKLQQQFTAEEIAEGYLIPAQLSVEEQEESNQELLKFRMERLANRSEKQRLIAELTRLRIRIQKYLRNDFFLKDYSFGSMLSEYITILEKPQKEFARDIDLHPSKLSRILHEKEEPGTSLAYRLEKHSDGIIPAVFWWKLIIRKQAHLIEEEVKQRRIEGDRVKNALKFST